MIAAIASHATSKSPGAIALLVVPGTMALIGLVAWFNAKQRQANARHPLGFTAPSNPSQLQALAAANGWAYAAKGSHELATDKNLRTAALMSGGVRNVVSGTSNGWRFTAFEVGGREETDCSVVIHLPVPLPLLSVLSKEQVLGDMGARAIHFESADFRDRFCVLSDSPRFAYDFVNPLVMQRMLASAEVSYEITGTDFALSAKRALTADALTRTLDVAVAILGAVPDFVWRNVGGLPPQ